MTREPKLVQSSRIDNLYETWQDKFCVDEKSICARDTVDKWRWNMKKEKADT